MATTYKINKLKVQEAIRAQKWDKAMYSYALGAMTPWSGNLFDYYKKSELVDMFYVKIETKFHCISDFTTFRNDNFYL